MSQELTLKQKGDRMLVVLYRLSCGAPGVQVRKDDWIAECEKLRVMEMTEDEFRKFHQDTVKQFSPTQRMN